MLKSFFGAAAAAALAIGTVTVPAPAQADQFATLPVHPEWGSVTGTDGRLLNGCRIYTFSYAITPPEGIWGLEVVIKGPTGLAVNNNARLDSVDGDPLNGTVPFTLCRNATRPGTYTVYAKLTTVEDEFSNEVKDEGQLPPDTFTLTRKARQPQVWVAYDV